MTVSTHDLTKGVFVGVLLSGLFFASKVARVLRVDSRPDDDGRSRTNGVAGQVFFALVRRFKREGVAVEVVGLNEASASMMDRFVVHDKSGPVQELTH